MCITLTDSSTLSSIGQIDQMPVHVCVKFCVSGGFVLSSSLLHVVLCVGSFRPTDFVCEWGVEGSQRTQTRERMADTLVSQPDSQSTGYSGPFLCVIDVCPLCYPLSAAASFGRVVCIVPHYCDGSVVGLRTQTPAEGRTRARGMTGAMDDCINIGAVQLTGGCRHSAMPFLIHRRSV